MYVYRKTNDTVAVALAQLPGLIFLTLFSFNLGYPMLPIVANVTPEPLFIPVMNLFNFCILRLYFNQTSRNAFKNILLLAFVSGLGLAPNLIFSRFYWWPLLLSHGAVKSCLLRLSYCLLCFGQYLLFKNTR